MAKKASYDELKQWVKRLKTQIHRQEKEKKSILSDSYLLRERIKELTCLYDISGHFEQPDTSLEEIFTGVVHLLPPAWHYPEITCARITFEGSAYTTDNFTETPWRQACDITVNGTPKGRVEVFYLKKRPPHDEGPFLTEERKLLTIVGERLGHTAERIQAEKRITHLTRALQAIRNVNQLIAREKDRDRLLNGICERLIDTRGYFNAWIALMDETRQVIRTAESGLGDTFKPLTDLLNTGTFPACANKALARKGVTATKDPASACTNCPLSAHCQGRGAMTVRLEHQGRVYGLLSASIPRTFLEDQEELGLFREVAADISFALQSIEVEEALRESENTFKRVSESAQDAVIMMNEQGNITFWNNAAKVIFGWSSSEAMGANTHMLLCPERYRGAFQRAFPRFQKTGTGNAIGTTIELMATTKDRGEIVVELSLASIKIKGKWHAAAIVRDITSRKQAEEALKESEAQKKAILDASIDRIRLSDTNMRIIWANETHARELDMTPEELAGRICYEVFVGRDSPCPECPAQKALTTGKIEHTVLARSQVGGTDKERYLDSYAVPLKNESGEIVNMMIITRDITARKQAEEKIQASLREKEVLLKEIHHRVKNNLQVIASLLSLQSQHIKDKESRAMFQESQNRVRSMALIHEKLYTSEDLAHIDIAEYIRSLTHQLITTYRTKASRVSMNIAVTDIFLTITTAIPCGLIINELVANALKHAFPHQREGTITVSMSPSDTDTLTLTVSDTGIGFPEAIDFNTTTTLGMQLVTGLVKQLEGTITLDRREGTTVTITFRGGVTV